MMAALGRQPLRARRGRAPRVGSAEVTAPRSRARQELVDTAHGALRRRPRRRRRGARRVVEHLVDRKGRVVALRTPRGRRPRRSLRASLVLLYVGLTLGAQAVSAIGVGVAKAARRRHRHRVRRCPARTTTSSPTMRCSTRSTSSVCRWCRRADRDAPLAWISRSSPTRASTSPTADGARARFLPWNQARNDVDQGREGDRGGGRRARHASSCSGRRPRRVRPVLLPPLEAAARGAGPHVRSREPARGAREPARCTCSTVVTGTRWPWRSRSPTWRRSLRPRRPRCASLRGAPLKSTRPEARRDARRAPSVSARSPCMPRRALAGRCLADRRAPHARVSSASAARDTSR